MTDNYAYARDIEELLRSPKNMSDEELKSITDAYMMACFIAGITIERGNSGMLAHISTMATMVSYCYYELSRRGLPIQMSDNNKTKENPFEDFINKMDNF